MKTTIKIIESNIRGQFDRTKKIAPVILQGAPGRGKSATLKQICKDNGWHLIYASIAAMDISELSGLPSDKHEPKLLPYSSHGNDLVTEWSCPEVIYQANMYASEGTPVVISLEDIHESDRSTQKALYEFLLERKLKNFKLDDNVAIVGTMNTSDEAGFTGFSSAVVNRLAFLRFEISPEEWYDVAGRFYHHFVASFLKNNAEFLSEPENVNTPYGTPRSWEALSDQIKLLDEDFVVANLEQITRQYVSPQAAVEFTKHVQYLMKIDFASVVKKKKLVRISELNTIDQILYTFMIPYIHTVDDAKYLVKMINQNIDEETYIGYLMAAIYTKYQARSRGENLSLGLDLVISKLLGYDKLLDNDNTAEHLKALKSIKFEDPEALLAKASAYIL